MKAPSNHARLAWARSLRSALATPAPAGMVFGAAAIVGVGLLPTMVRWINIPLVLWWPGRCLIATVFGTAAERWAPEPAAEPSPLDSRPGVVMPPRLAMEILGSIIAWPILSLAIVCTGQRITQGTLSATLLALVGLLAVVRQISVRREWARDHVRRFEDASERQDAAARSADAEVAERSWLAPLVAVGLAILVGGATVAWVPRQPERGYTQFAFAGNWALARDPVQVNEGQPVVARFELANHTSEVATYRVSGVVADPEDGTVLNRWDPVSVTLTPGERTVGEIRGEVSTATCRQRMSLQLSSSNLPDTEGLVVQSGSTTRPLPPELRAWSPLTALIDVGSEVCGSD